MPVHGEDREKGVDPGTPHLSRVASIMEEDEASDPLHISFFGSNGVVLRADSLTHLIQRLRFRTDRRAVYILGHGSTLGKSNEYALSFGHVVTVDHTWLSLSMSLT